MKQILSPYVMGAVEIKVIYNSLCTISIIYVIPESKIRRISDCSVEVDSCRSLCCCTAAEKKAVACC